MADAEREGGPAQACLGDDEALGDGREEVPFTQQAFLSAGTYYYCAIGSNEAGLGFGEIKKFVVPEEVEDPGSGGGDGGCGCRVSSERSGSTLALSFAALLLLALGRRRRRA